MSRQTGLIHAMLNPDVGLVLKEDAQVVARCRAPTVPKPGQQSRLTDADGHWRSYEFLRTEASSENPGSTTVWVKPLHEGGPTDNPVIWRTWRPKR